MVFVVAMHLAASPERVGGLLTTIRGTLSSARTLQPGRRSTRLFQRLGEPTRLLDVSEWTDEGTFGQFQDGALYAETIDSCTAAPAIEPLQRLRHYERMDQRIAVAACATITSPPEQAATIEAEIVGEGRQQFVRAEGLVWREIYRSRNQPGRLVVVHGWRALDDLERFRERGSRRGEAALADLGATTTRFTGTLAAELSLIQS